ncbi:MAG: TetR/AcrR family transcriptional regulator [Anaerolineales bacterium]
MSPRPRRNQQHTNLPEAIKDTAWEQIAKFGAPALSLRAIGRSLRITAPAIYNYFPDRDALMSALIVDAFTSFGQALEAARDALPKEDLAGRFTAAGLAYRTWAVAHPQHFLLIFGSAVPGETFSMDKLGPAPLNSFLVLVGILDEAQQAGALHLPEGYVHWTPALQAQADALCDMHIANDPLTIYLAIEAWTRVHGLAALELFGYLPAFLGQSLEDFMRSEFDAYTDLLFGKLKK